LERHRTVPVDAEPAQRLLDVVDGLGHLAGGVGVLDPEADLSTHVAREEPVEEERTDVADVQEARRARCHANSYGHVDSVRRMRTLTLRELNRAFLARQMLLERKRIGVLRALERLGGMQAQWAPGPYFGLWARVEGFRPAALERELRAGTVLRPAMMRGTLHLVTARDYPVFFAALRDMPTWYQPHHVEHALKAVAGARRLAPLTQRDMLDHLEHEHGHADELERRRIGHALRRHAHLLHAQESSLWSGRPGRLLFHAHPEPDVMDSGAARAELVGRYLAAFGPAARADVAEWSGLRVGEVADVLETLEPLRHFRDESGRELLDVRRAPLPPADTPAPVRLVPRFDNLILSHKDRTRVIADEHRGAVIEGGWVKATVLVDGFVAGTWDVEDTRVRLEPFAPWPRAVKREVEDEAVRLEAWLA